MAAGDVPTYGGTTIVQQGNLVVHNTNALGGTGADQTQTIDINPVTTIAVECDGEPKQDNEFVRRERDRLQV